MSTIGVGSVTLPGAFASLGLTIESYDEQPFVGNSAELLDEFGDLVESTRFGVASGVVVHEATLAFDCNSGSVPSSFTIGGSGGIESVSISTSNNDYPKIRIRWYTGLSSSGVCDAGASYTITDLASVIGKRKAQALGGMSAGTGAYVQSSEASYSVSFSPLWDITTTTQGGTSVTTVSLKGFAFSNGRATASIEVAGGSVSSTVTSPWELTEGPSISKTYDGYPTATASTQKKLTRNTSSED